MLTPLAHNAQYIKLRQQTNSSWGQSPPGARPAAPAVWTSLWSPSGFPIGACHTQNIDAFSCSVQTMNPEEGPSVLPVKRVAKSFVLSLWFQSIKTWVSQNSFKGVNHSHFIWYVIFRSKKKLNVMHNWPHQCFLTVMSPYLVICYCRIGKRKNPLLLLLNSLLKCACKKMQFISGNQPGVGSALWDHLVFAPFQTRWKL